MAMSLSAFACALSPIETDDLPVAMVLIPAVTAPVAPAPAASVILPKLVVALPVPALVPVFTWK